LPPDFLLGRWREVEQGFRLEIAANPSREGPRYFVKEGSHSGEFSYFGDVIGEFSRVGDSDVFLGRHTWGGKRSNDSSWGGDGGLVIEPHGNAGIRITYADSKYTGGWVYDKITHDEDSKTNP